MLSDKQSQHRHFPKHITVSLPTVFGQEREVYNQLRQHGSVSHQCHPRVPAAQRLFPSYLQRGEATTDEQHRRIVRLGITEKGIAGERE